MIKMANMPSSFYFKSLSSRHLTQKLIPAEKCPCVTQQGLYESYCRCNLPCAEDSSSVSVLYQGSIDIQIFRFKLPVAI